MGPAKEDSLEIHEVRSVEDIWVFVKERFIAKGLDKELIHGVRHIQHVREECVLLCGYCWGKIGSDVVKCLRAAVDVHDLGRTEKGDHAAISAEMFSKMPIEGLIEEEALAIRYAVQYHGRGLWGLGIPRAEMLAEKVLGLLCVCDHADAASSEGAARAALALKKLPVLSSRFAADGLRQLMENGCTPDMMNVYKNDSLVAHWAYNYFATSAIRKPVSHLLTPRYLEEHGDPKLAMYRAIIEPLLLLQEEKDKK